MIGEEVIAVYGDAGDGKELFEVQKLVRCKECKHRQNPYAPKWCYEMSKETDPDDYCSYGERKESE